MNVFVFAFFVFFFWGWDGVFSNGTNVLFLASFLHRYNLQ